MTDTSFDAIAPVYDFLARLVFGKSILKAQTHFLNAIPPKARILIIGGGTGWILTELLKKKVANHIDYVEASAKMIHMARHSYHKFKRKQPLCSPDSIHFIQGTENNLPADARYEVIITFFVLDIYHDSNLQQMVRSLDERLLPGGIWLFADFQTVRGSQRRWWHPVLVNLMFLFFRLTCHLQNRKLPDYENAFSQLQLKTEKTKTFFSHLIVSKMYRKNPATSNDAI